MRADQMMKGGTYQTAEGVKVTVAAIVVEDHRVIVTGHWSRVGSASWDGVGFLSGPLVVMVARPERGH